MRTGRQAVRIELGWDWQITNLSAKCGDYYISFRRLGSSVGVSDPGKKPRRTHRDTNPPAGAFVWEVYPNSNPDLHAHGTSDDLQVAINAVKSYIDEQSEISRNETRNSEIPATIASAIIDGMTKAVIWRTFFGSKAPKTYRGMITREEFEGLYKAYYESMHTPAFAKDE